MADFNLINLLGKIPRSNVGFEGYEENPEFFEQAGQSGVKFIKTPDWISGGRAFTVGNTVFMPSEAIESVLEYPYDLDLRGMKESDRDIPWTAMAKEEIPHVSQYRERGLLGFLGKYLGDLFKSKFSQKELYEKSESLEGFHWSHIDEKSRRLKSVLGD